MPNETQQIIIDFQNISALIEGFLLERKSRGLQPRSIEFYEERLKHFSMWLSPQAITQIEQVNAGVIRGFLIHLEEGHKLSYVHGYFRTLRAFFRWLSLEDIMPPEWKSPMRKVHAPKVPTEPLEPIPVADIRALLATCKDGFTGVRDKAIILTLLDTGARASELLSINLADSNLITGDILIRQGKGKKPRTVFVGKSARRVLRSYIRLRHDHSPVLFVTDEGNKLTYDGLRAIITRRARLAGIQPPPLHGFRRSFTISLLRQGVDVVTISRLLGHNDLQMILLYAHQNSDDLREKHAANSPVDGL